MSLLNLLGDIFEPAAALIDNLHTSKEEKLEAKARMLTVQTEFLAYALDFESKALEAKTSIILAETQSESWVTRNWRPITMLSFVGAILGYWFGLTPDSVPEIAVEWMFDLVKIGLGGYVVGRSAEKIVPGLMTSFKAKEKT